ncbi:MAG: aldehyde dehydrogenase family protein [Gammaproteobacteria bacterium]|nr:MAG: aldehyde dehydrogenase family protein [Gammaproteobacteria bacterium]
MRTYENLYINGQWTKPNGSGTDQVINPATEEVVAKVPYGDETDVDNAVQAARAAFDAWSTTPSAERADYLRKIADEMKKRSAEFEVTMVEELGIPVSLADDYQVCGPIDACEGYANRCSQMDEVEEINNSMVIKEAVGVCAFINPWNYPLSQMIGKVAPALAAGCTMVVKAASQTPSHAFILAEAIDAAGLPAGVFNLVHGAGRTIGEKMCSHPEVDMVSFTGSTGAGIKIAEAAAPTVKRVCQELGGKSAYIITEDANLADAVAYGVEDVMVNTGQTCTALTRMLVAESHYEEAVQIAKDYAEAMKVGDPADADSYIGPMSSQSQRNTVLSYIDKGIAEGARLVTGGTQMPDGISKGAYVLPTIFADVNNKMVIAQEEIFGPVLAMIPYSTIDQAVEIANDTVFGLSSAVYAKDKQAAIAIARRLRAGQCYVNGGDYNYDAPFGGYKQSGNGREWGDEGLNEFVEIKSIQM